MGQTQKVVIVSARGVKSCWLQLQLLLDPEPELVSKDEEEEKSLDSLVNELVVLDLFCSILFLFLCFCF